MRARDRLTALALLLAASLAWMGVALVLTTVYPELLEVRLAAALAIGLAVALTVSPLAWLAAVARHRRMARRGDWPRALRRGVLAGALGSLVVALQVTGTTSLPIVVFAVTLVVFIELTLSYRR